MELFKTNTEKQDCTLKGNTAQHYLYPGNPIFFILTNKVYNPGLTSPRSAVFRLTG